MRASRCLVLAGLAVVCALLPLNLAGCLPGTGSGGGSGLFNLPPTVVITMVPDPANGVAPYVVQFDSSNSTDDGTIVNRAWDFGDGSTSLDITPSHTFRTNGTFTITLTLTDDQGAQASKTTTVSVVNRPVAVLLVDREVADTAPAQFSFDASQSFDPDAKPGDVLEYLWDFGDGTRETVATTPHTFANPGIYRVTLTVTGAAGVPGTAEQLIQVGIPVPTMEFRAPWSGIQHLVVPQGADIWTYVVFDVDPSAAYTLVAGLDADLNSQNNNDIRLGTRLANGTLNTTDLDLRVPTALELTTSGVAIPTGTYYLWAELRTDLVEPVRVYAAPTVHVIRPYTTEISADTPTLPAVSGEQWQIVVPKTTNRQIVDLGALNQGDQVFLDLLTTPGYAIEYSQPGYSAMLLDSTLSVYAWFYENNGRMVFNPYTKLVIGAQSQSSHYYLVLDGTDGAYTPNAQVRVARSVATTYLPPRQTVYLNFAGGQGKDVAVGGIMPVTLGAYTGPATMNAATLKAAVAARLQTIFAPYSITILSSETDSIPTTPYTGVYFEDADQLSDYGIIPSDVVVRSYGLADVVDPRNQTVSGNVLVRASLLATDFTTLDTEVKLGTALGNAVAHQLGFMFGLAETTGVATDVMNVAASLDRNDLQFTVAPLAPLFTAPQPFPAGTQQDAPKVLLEVLR